MTVKYNFTWHRILLHCFYQFSWENILFFNLISGFNSALHLQLMFPHVTNMLWFLLPGDTVHWFTVKDVLLKPSELSKHFMHYKVKTKGEKLQIRFWICRSSKHFFFFKRTITVKHTVVCIPDCICFTQSLSLSFALFISIITIRPSFCSSNQLFTKMAKAHLNWMKE